MTKVIAQKDMMQYSGMKAVEFPAGTLLTPAAKDWASEHCVEVVIGTDEKAELLKQTIKAVMNNIDKTGGLLTRNELVKIVASSLERMGCIIENK